MEYARNSVENLDLITTSDGIEFIRSSDGRERFAGYAAVFYDPKNAGTEYKVREGLRERIAPTAFDGTDFSDVELWFEHSNTCVMGEVSGGTLQLRTDAKGLRFEAPYDAADPDHVKAFAKLKKNLVRGASIQFHAEYSTHKEGKDWIRTITKIKNLKELSLVKRPAYPATSVMMRSAELDKWSEIQIRIERAKKILEAKQ